MFGSASFKASTYRTNTNNRITLAKKKNNNGKAASFSLKSRRAKKDQELVIVVFTDLGSCHWSSVGASVSSVSLLCPPTRVVHFMDTSEMAEDNNHGRLDRGLGVYESVNGYLRMP